jgi:U4/U6.U5 tri-snRNP-associated protein 1
MLVEKKFSTDYMTQEEYASKEFKKKKIKKKGIVSLTPHEEKIEDIREAIINKQVYDDYDELNFYLEKERKLKNKEKELKVEERIKSEYEPINNPDTQEMKEDEQIEFISDTTEFLKKVPTKKEMEEDMKIIKTSGHTISLKDAKNGMQSVVNIPLPTDRLRYGASSVINVNSSSNSNTLDNEFLKKKRKLSEKEDTQTLNETQSEIQQEKIEIYEEPLVGKGVVTALMILKKRGLVGKKQLWGRFKDKIHTSNEVFLKEEDKKIEKKKGMEFNFELDYRDSQGRILTPKEMYRQQSYIFHGKGPGKKKTEKKLLREQLEEKMKNQDPNEASKTFKYLKAMQKKSKTPFIVLQGKSNS